MAQAAPARQRPALNAEQEAMVCAPLDQPLLVLACAGTGKTTSLIQRLAFMLDQGVPPHRILLMTFTIKMAEEARQRLQAQGVPGAGSIVCCTVHSFCFRVLRRFHTEAGFERPPTVLSSLRDWLQLVKRCDRLAKLQRTLEEVCGWLGLPQTTTTWQALVNHLWERDQALVAGAFRAAAACVAEKKEKAAAAAAERKLSKQQSPEKRKAAAQEAVMERDMAGEDPLPPAVWDEGEGGGAQRNQQGQQHQHRQDAQLSPSKALRTTGCGQSPQKASRPAAAEAVSPTKELRAGMCRQLRLDFSGQGMGLRAATSADGPPAVKGRGRGRRKKEASDGLRQATLSFGGAGLTACSSQRSSQPQPSFQEQQPSSQQQGSQRQRREGTEQQEPAGPPSLSELDAEVQAGLLQRLYLALCKRHNLQQYERLGSNDAERAALLGGEPSTTEAKRTWRKELKQLRGWIMGWKRKGYTPDMFAPGQHERHVWELCQREMRRMNSIDFSDMLADTVRLLKERPGVLQRLQRQHTHLCVDELQDCSPLQVELVLLLGGSSGRITAVGDDDQSIYSFMAATPEVFPLCRQVLDADYSQTAQQRVLNRNYRSSPNILTVATTLLGGQGSGKRLEAARSAPGAPVQLTCYADEVAEARGIAERIQREVAGGTRRSEIAVLYRAFNSGAGKTYTRLVAELEQRGIAYRLIKAKPLLEHRLVQLVVASLRLLLNPDCDCSLQQVYCDWPRLGVTSERRLLEYQAGLELTTGHSRSLLECAREVAAEPGGGPHGRPLLRKPQREAVRGLLGMIDGLREELPGLQPAEVIDRFLEMSGVWERERQRLKRVQEGVKRRGAGGGSDEDDSSDSDSVSDVSDSEEGGEATQQDAGNEQAQGCPDNSMEASGAASGAGLGAGCREEQEEGQDQEGQQRARHQRYAPKTRCRGPLGMLQRLAADFPAGAWQLRPEFGLDSSGEEDGAAQDGEQATQAGRQQQEGARPPQECKGAAPLADFLSYVVVDATEEKGPLDDAVVISTQHSAKGLEFDVVFSPRWQQGAFPHDMPQEDGGPQPQAQLHVGRVPVPLPAPAEVEFGEGRRLAHVAATRPRHRHYISWALRTLLTDGGSETLSPGDSMSMFLHPVLEELQGVEPPVVAVEDLSGWEWR